MSETNWPGGFNPNNPYGFPEDEDEDETDNVDPSTFFEEDILSESDNDIDIDIDASHILGEKMSSDEDDSIINGERSINEEEKENCFFESSGHYIYRHHRQPRTTMFAPTECDDPPPLPLQNIEIYRETFPDKDTGLAKEEDSWNGTEADARVFRTTANGVPIP